MCAQKIIDGPSKWEIMLALFDGQDIKFRLEDGSVIVMDGIDAIWDMHCYESLGDQIQPEDVDYYNGGISEGYLIRGALKSSDGEIFVEYRPLSGRGLCAVVASEDCNSAFMPRIWSDIMGLVGPYNASPSQ